MIWPIGLDTSDLMLGLAQCTGSCISGRTVTATPIALPPHADVHKETSTNRTIIVGTPGIEVAARTRDRPAR
jgi:hypothetical protein